MIYLKLFLVFLKIGAVSFGGGYGMISLIREEVLSNAWLTEEEMIDFIAVSESTPGPIAVNIATFIGSSQGGFLGAFVATLGVVLPSLIIIILIAALLKKVLKYAGVQATLNGIRPAVASLVLATAVILFLKIIFGLQTVESFLSFDWKALAIFGIVGAVAVLFSIVRKRSFSPILLLILSGGLGMIFYL